MGGKVGQVHQLGWDLGTKLSIVKFINLEWERGKSPSPILPCQFLRETFVNLKNALAFFFFFNYNLPSNHHNHLSQALV